MEKQTSPLWKRARLAAGGELPVKVLNFIKDLIADSGIHPFFTSSYNKPDSDVFELRAKVESLNWQLFNAELEVDTLRRAMTFAKTNVQRIANERDKALSCINQSRIPRQLPTEIIMEIAEHLRWDQWYKTHSNRSPREDSYSTIRAMAIAFSAIDGMEEAILRKIPLVLLESMSRRNENENWMFTFAALPTSQREIIGACPRLCHLADDDAISRIHAHEEVHLVLSSHYRSSDVSSLITRRPASHLHLTLVRNTTIGLQDFADKFLNPTLASRISTFMLINTLPNLHFGVSNTLSIETPGNAIFERASIPLLALIRPSCFRFPAHLTILEITDVSPISIGKLGEMANALRAIRSSLQSLHLIGFRDPEVGVYNGAIDQEPVIPITMDFPFLQELCFESLDHNDLSALMGVAHLECASLNSLVIRSLRVPVWKRTSMPSLFALLAEKIPSKFPRLHRLAYSVRLVDGNDEYELERYIHEQELETSLLESLSVLTEPVAHVAEINGAPSESAWLVPNLQVLELKDSSRVQEWLICLASARLLTPNAANIRTIFLSQLTDKPTTTSSSSPLLLNSLRLLVPEVLPGKIPPLFYHQ